MLIALLSSCRLHVVSATEFMVIFYKYAVALPQTIYHQCGFQTNILLDPKYCLVSWSARLSEFNRVSITRVMFQAKKRILHYWKFDQSPTC